MESPEMQVPLCKGLFLPALVLVHLDLSYTIGLTAAWLRGLRPIVCLSPLPVKCGKEGGYLSRLDDG